MAAFNFTVPTLPKPVYKDLTAIKKKFDISSQQIVILGVMALKHLHEYDRAVVEQMVEAVRGIYCQDFKPSSKETKETKVTTGT